MLKKNKTKIDSDMNLWSIFYFNPIANRETEAFKRGIIKSLKNYNPIQYHFEELTSFLLLNASFNSNLCKGDEDDVKELSIEDYSTNLLKKIKQKLNNEYENYLQNLIIKLKKDLQKNRELKEAINILNNRLNLEELRKDEFNTNLDSAFENLSTSYFNVINNSTIYLLEHHECEHSIVEMGDVGFLIETEKNFTQLIDEMILFNFSKIYTTKTEKILNDYIKNLELVNKFLKKNKIKTPKLEEALDLLKGKSFEILDDIHDIRRQLARQNRAEDAIKTEIESIKDEKIEVIFAGSNQKEAIQKIAKQTDTTIELIGHWFGLIRKFELLERKQIEKNIEEKNIEILLEFFIQMECLRIWSELFYDISYFTIRKGKVVVTLDKEVKSEIETDSVLVVEDVYKTYRLPKSRVYALRGIDFEIKKGEFLAIMGPSGAGKTTLVNILTGLDSPDKGVVYLNGKNIALMDDKDITEFRRDQVGLVFQFYQLFAELTALENVSMPAEMANIPVEEARKRALEILKIVDLEKFANQYPDKLSGGQQQRVAIARALINEPAIIVADQLTGDLDSVTGQQIIGYLRKINTEKGTTVLLVTHNKSVATQADRILTMEDGEILEEIDMSALRQTEGLI